MLILRLEDEWEGGWERKWEGREEIVARREEDDWGRKMWRWRREVWTMYEMSAGENE